MKLRVEQEAWAGFSDALRQEPVLESAGIILTEAVGPDRDALVARHFFVLPDEGYIVRERDRIQIHPVALNRYARQARVEGLSILTVHTHPGTTEPWFSPADDIGDARLMPSFEQQMPGPHGSLVIAGKSGEVVARAWRDGERGPMVVRIVGQTIRTMLAGTAGGSSEGWFARQRLALGPHGQATLRGLHVGVVGLGGTGSVTAMQLAHMGVRRLTLVDGDRLESSNVSRVVGASSAAGAGSLSKVDVVRRYIEQLGIECDVHAVEGDLGGQVPANDLLACDVIMSCVDRHTPRALLNRLAYDSLIPVVDMGSAFRVDHHGAVVASAGRVVVVGPGRPCLACWGHIDARQLHVEALPEGERASLQAEGYIEGADVPQPSVMPFNTMLSGAAVIELLRLVTGFAGAENPPNRLAFDFENGVIRRNQLVAGNSCCICGSTSSEAQSA